MIKVLFVCLGNICRSPLAQGIFENKIEIAGLSEHYYADSAGTSAWHRGEKPDKGSIHIARVNHINIENQRSRPVVAADQNEFDYFIAMDDQNARSLINEFGVPKEKIFKLRNFDPEPENGNVPDPYGGGSDGFARVFQIIDRSMLPFIEYLKNQNG
ncbi:MAG: low molecular weight phosphotyrosine protein phosphatase [Spirochaetia bacterium]|nr:low molecular weight phosphotyrosine protein phosphatase [Spirochaetia bacterium]